MNKGTLYIISAPSGTGKSSLIQALLNTRTFNNLKLSISHTTRAMRPKEEHGKHYFFISVMKFKRMIAQGEFLEYAKIFDHYYGTSKKYINNILNTGIDVCLNIDWQGAKQIRDKIPNTRSIFILPPSKEVLNDRLIKRGQDNNKVIAKRMAQAVTDMIHFKEYNYIIINDKFNKALFNLQTIIQSDRLRIEIQKKNNKNLIKKLLKK